MLCMRNLPYIALSACREDTIQDDDAAQSLVRVTPEEMQGLAWAEACKSQIALLCAAPDIDIDMILLFGEGCFH